MTNIYALLLVLFTVLYTHYNCNVEAIWAEVNPLEKSNEEELKAPLATVQTSNRVGDASVLKRTFNRLPGICTRLRRRRITILCNMGNYCSVKKGNWHGHICSCPRGSKCSHFFVKNGHNNLVLKQSLGVSICPCSH